MQRSSQMIVFPRSDDSFFFSRLYLPSLLLGLTSQGLKPNALGPMPSQQK